VTGRPGGLLAQAVYVTCRETDRARRAGDAVVRFAGGLASELLDPEEQLAITVRLYGHAREERQGLFDWERLWFEQSLPKPPARLLVGGSGRGREVRALLARGYDVWAFDPALAALRQSERRNPSASFHGWFGYEELVRDRAASPTAPRLIPAGVSFDAVLLGWGSLTHVLREDVQDALLRLLDELAPSGPILASFFLSQGLDPQSRAERLGRRAAALLSLGRGRDSGHGQRVRLLAHTGFVYVFDEVRLRALAAQAHRRLELHLDGAFPRATFHPTSSSSTR
jgi:hypothetical protein